MLKGYKVVLISLLLSFVLVFASACADQKDKNNDKNSDKTSSTSTEDVFGDDFFDDFFDDEEIGDEETTSSTLERTETIIKGEDYTEGSAKAIFDFSKGKDAFGGKSISIIGDSISQGLNATKLYDGSWASLFRNKINQTYGSNNMGFVSLSSYYSKVKNDVEITSSEIHTVKADDAWQNYNTATKKFEAYKGGPNNYNPGSSDTPGNYSFIAKPLAAGAKIEISLNRKQDGIDRHINGFYIYYTEGSTYGKFQVKVNGTEVKVVDCAAAKVNYYARTPYIAIPAGCGDDIKIEIIKLDNKLPVQISGIGYIDNPDAVTVNNFSLSGIRLIDYSDNLLKSLCKANVVVFALGTNDSGYPIAPERFKAKLKVVVDACKANGSTLIVTDFIWSDYPKYKSLLAKAATSVNGYYIDFSKYNQNQILDKNLDSVHPTNEGHKYIAEKLFEFLRLN